MPISGVKFAGPPITPGDIEQLEKAINVEFPAAYREFLLKYNGGRPTPEDAFGEGDSGSIMGEFYSVKHDKQANTIAHQRHAFDERIPADLLPIAVDMGGNQVCIGTAPDNRGKIYFWSMVDEPRPEDEDKRANIRLLADDFVSFLDTFCEEVDDEDDD